MEYHVRRSRGFSMIEVLVVVAVVAIIASLVVPGIAELRERSGLRAARTLVVTALSSARSAAIQKGKTATLTIADGAISVSALSGLRVAPVQIQGPVHIHRTTRAELAPLAGAPTEITYDARGLITPNSTRVARYELRLGSRADTLCITGAGMLMAKGCVL
jgi:type IV fimbrial biogenesis protein FimT